MMPAEGLRGLRVALDALDAAGVPVAEPITVTWTSNALEKSEELSPGGFLVLCSPRPTNGITALSITSGASCVVHVTAVG